LNGVFPHVGAILGKQKGVAVGGIGSGSDAYVVRYFLRQPRDQACGLQHKEIIPALSLRIFGRPGSLETRYLSFLVCSVSKYRCMEPGRGAHTRSVELPSCSFPTSPVDCFRVRETSTLAFVALSESCRSKTSESSLVLPATDRTLADLSLRCCTLEVGREGRGLRLLAAGLSGISPACGCGENMVMCYVDADHGGWET
jgi:hypothetical protein